MNKVNVSDAKILSALISTPTISAAASALGIGERTIFRRLENPSFRAEFDRLQRETVTAACTALNARVAGAIETMDEVMRNGENSPQTRLSAARAILDSAFKAAEIVDIQNRLDALERRATAQIGR